MKPATIQKRIAFAEGYANFDWTKVLWSDEMSIRLGPQGQTWVQRPIGAAWILPTWAQAQASWGCMSAAGVGECHLFVQNLESFMKHILNKHLLQSARRFWPSGQWWFQQDNDPKHSSRLVQGWLNQKGIDRLEWPPYSPDLNPIEHLV